MAETDPLVKWRSRSETQRYLVVGLLFGMLFPILATIIELFVHDSSATWTNIVNAHVEQPLLWIIDTAPLFLTILFGLVGLKVDQIKKIRDQKSLRVDEQTEQLLALHSVSRHLAHEHNMDDLAEKVIEEVRQLFPYQFVSLFILEEENSKQFLRRIGGGEYFRDEWKTHRFEVGKEGVVGTVAAIGEMIVLNDVSQSEIYISGDGSVQSELASPLIAGQKVVGVLNIESQEKNAFDQNTIQLISTLATEVAVALQNVQIIVELSTERRRLDAILQNMADGLLVVDQNGIVQMVNPALVRMTGVSERALLRLSLSQLIGGPLYEDIFQRAMMQPDGMVSQMFEFPHKPGMFVNAAVSVLKDAQGNMEGAVAVVRDVTREHEVDRMKTDFISLVSHELRTPLTSVLGFVNLVRRDFKRRIVSFVPQEDARAQKSVTRIQENLDIIQGEGMRLTRLINDVLDIAKMEAGHVDWHIDDIDLTHVVKDSITATTGLFERKSVAIQPVIPDSPVMISADYDRMVQVITNLISNASKFTDEGQIEVAIRLILDGNLPEPLGTSLGRPENIEGSWALVSVTDSGVGIAEENLAKVFERFKQVGDTLTDRPKGTGLGLPICKEIIEHHQGTLWVESQPGKGSRFSFLVPLISETALYGPSQFLAQVEDFIVAGDSSQTILVVDDEGAIRRLLSQELGDAGYQVITVEDGSRAVQIAREQQPDLIILDVMMPGLNGFDALVVLKHDPRTANIPVMFLTIADDRERGMQLGAAAYLSKPIDSTLLLRSIHQLMGGARKNRNNTDAVVMTVNSTTCKQVADVLQSEGIRVYPQTEWKELKALLQSVKPALVVVSIESLGEKPEEQIKILRSWANPDKPFDILLLDVQGTAGDRVAKSTGADVITDLPELARKIKEQEDHGHS